MVMSLPALITRARPVNTVQVKQIDIGWMMFT
jgi:hypothetical protein